MKTSMSRPSGALEDWPVKDWLAWYVLLQVSELYLLGSKPANDEDARRAIIKAVQQSAVAIELEDGEKHWLVHDYLAGRYGIFFDTFRGIYTTPDRLMRYGTARSLRALGPETVEWASTLSKRLAEQRRLQRRDKEVQSVN